MPALKLETSVSSQTAGINTRKDAFVTVASKLFKGGNMEQAFHFEEDFKTHFKTICALRTDPHILTL